VLFFDRTDSADTITLRDALLFGQPQRMTGMEKRH